ncbi:MAG TPA: hypothetical protein VH482_14110 [Thermomicrobiales bacterium]|jgi:hypothetical protein
MDAEYRNPTHRTAVERHAHVLRVIGDCHWSAAGRLAAEERQRHWLAAAATSRQLRGSSRQPAVFATLLAATREAVGSALIRAGGRLRGTDPQRGRRVAPGA